MNEKEKKEYKTVMDLLAEKIEPLFNNMEEL